MAISEAPIRIYQLQKSKLFSKFSATKSKIKEKRPTPNLLKQTWHYIK